MQALNVAGALVAGKYRIVKELGAGGMGSVWQAVHTVTEREFAIKFLHPSCASSQSLLARFFQEAKVSGKLRHPSIIEIFDVGTAPELGGAPYLVMELLDGASLDVLVRRIGPLPPRIVLESIADASRALALAHDKGIVHRDLKPANIFLHRPGTGAIVPKVLDFGISKIAGAGGPGGGGPDLSSGLTQTGAVLGSPLYMSPEQAASDKTIDGRSDIHALGVVLWECLSGKPPFSADTYNNLVVQIITGDRPRLADTMPTMAGDIAAIVDRAMARRREDRFQNATELAEALERAVAALPASTSIAARTSAAELFSRLPASSIRPPSSGRAEAATVDASTTGGVSVPSVRQAVDPSPAAFTMPAPQSASDAERSTGRTAYAATQQAEGAAYAVPLLASAPTLAATVAQPELPRPPAPPATRTQSRAPLFVGAGLGAALVLGAALFFGTRRGPAQPPPAAPSAASLAPTTEASAAMPPPAPADSVVTAPSATASAVASASATAAPPPPRYPGARTPPAPPPPKPASTQPSKPKDSVQSSGF